MASQQVDEKQEEKFHEKEVEKQEEKWEEKWHRDPLGVVVGAVILIWLGIVLLAGNLGILDTFEGLLDALRIQTWGLPVEVLPFVNARVWPIFFLGAGMILLVELVVRLLMPAYRRRVLGTAIGAIVFFALAFGKWALLGPLILIAIGISMLLGSFLKNE
jgi:hypothetical protein